MKKDWEYKKLGDITVFSQGIQVDVNLQTETFSPGKVRFLRIIDVTQGNVPPRYIDDPGEKYYLKADEIAMVRYGTIGFVCYGIEGVIANNLFKISIKDKSKLQSSYLQYFLKSDLFQSHIRKSVGGAALPSIKFGDIKHIMLGIPPLSEQKEIVEYLDSSFAKIDKLKENAAKNLEEAKALFQSALKEALESKKGWEYKALKDICTQLFAGGDVPKPNVSKKATTDFYIPIYSNGVENEGLYGYTDDARVNEPAVTISARGTIGALFRRYKPFFPAIRLITAVPNKDLLSVEFLFYALKVFTVRNSGTSIPQLTIPNIKKVTIPIPPLSEQQEIVSRLDSLNEKANTLQQNYSRICDECDALKQAILRQVFE